MTLLSIVNPAELLRGNIKMLLTILLIGLFMKTFKQLYFADHIVAGIILVL